jgi:hypothetical protein
MKGKRNIRYYRKSFAIANIEVLGWVCDEEIQKYLHTSYNGKKKGSPTRQKKILKIPKSKEQKHQSTPITKSKKQKKKRKRKPQKLPSRFALSQK